MLYMGETSKIERKILKKASDKEFAKIQRKMWKDGRLLRGEYLTEGIDY